jgi:hypothetical protein
MDKVVIYAFLSVIKEKSGNITSLLSIFQELVEGLLSTWVKKQLKGGRILDLQKDFKATYSIDIPLPTLKCILNNILHKNSSLLTTYQDNSFTVNNDFPEINLVPLLEKQQSDIDAFYDLYNRYLHIRGLNPNDYDLLTFFDQNKRYIIKCLNGDITVNENHQVQAQFIQKILYTKRYNELINRIFLGSIISSYIEMEVDDSTKHSKTLLLDTNFIISLLNLHSEESFENCKMLMEIAKQLKYKIEIMPFTIDETTALLNRVAENLNKITYFQSLDKDTIYHGCFRNGINSAGLTFIAGKFVDKLREQYGILTTDMMTNNSMISEAKNSTIYKKSKERQHNPDGALHDATALYYTQKKRKGNQKSFKDIEMWFVTDSKGFSENINIADGLVPLMIRAEELLNILWLSHPSYDSKMFIQTTIARLLSSTLNIVPDSRMLKALDKKIQLIKDYPISAKDCIQIAEVIGSIENQKLKLLLEKNTQEEILTELRQLSSLAEEKEKAKEKETDEFLNILKEDMQRSIAKERAILQKIKNEEILSMNIEVRNESSNREIALLEDLIKRDQEELDTLANDIILQIPIHAIKIVKGILIGIGIVACFGFILIGGLIYKYWDFFEPLLYLLSFIPWIFLYFVGVAYSKKLSIFDIKKILISRIENNIQKKKMNYIVRSELLMKRINENGQKIKKIQESIIFN